MRTIPLANRVLLLAMALLATPSVTGAQVVSVPPNLILPNYDRIPVGQQEGIEAGAYLARTGDAGSNWYNPAGLAKSDKSAVNASATAYEWTSTELKGFGETAGRSRINSVGTLFSAVLGKGPLKSDRWRLGFSIARPISWRPSSTELEIPRGQEKFAYASDVEFGVMIPAIAAAFAPGGVTSGTFRVGAGLGVAITSLSQTQTFSDRIVTPTSAPVALASFVADGSAWELRLNGGAQWDATPAITLGAKIATSSFSILGSSRMNLQLLDVDGPKMNDLVFRDPKADFDYRLPGEVSLGAAVRGKSTEGEIDVHYYVAIDPYDLYASTASASRTVVDSLGAITVTSVPLASTTNSARAVVNVAVGGSHKLTSALRVHGGFASDRSPVPDGEGSLFRQVNLNRITGGLSLTGSSLSGSLGFGYSYGSGTRGVMTTEGGVPVDTRLKVKTANLLFALSYSFQPS